jgi:cobalt-zinc-cadmium efflux system outer membrane protein
MKVLNHLGPTIMLNKTALGFVIGIVLLAYQGHLQAKELLTMPMAIEKTLSGNPILQLLPYQIRSAEAFKVQANLIPQPTVSLDLENAFGNGDNTGLSTSETTLTLGQVIELGDKRNSRFDAAKAKVYQLQKQVNIKQIDTLTETGKRYHEVLRLQAIADNYSGYIKQTEVTFSSIIKLAKSGSVGQAHITKIALEVAKLQAKKKRVLTRLRHEKTTLAMMWQQPVDFDRVAGALTKVPVLPTQQAMAALLNTNPQAELQQAEVALAQRRLQLALSQGQNDIEVGIGLRHLAETDDQAFVFEFSMPMGQKNPNKGNILAAQSTYQESQLKQLLLQKDTEMTISGLQDVLFANHEHAITLKKQLLPQVKKLLNQIINGYQHGQYSIIEWLDAQKMQFELQQESINTHNQIYLGLLELERLSGQALLKQAGVNNDQDN